MRGFAELCKEIRLNTNSMDMENKVANIVPDAQRVVWIDWMRVAACFMVMVLPASLAALTVGSSSKVRVNIL